MVYELDLLTALPLPSKILKVCMGENTLSMSCYKYYERTLLCQDDENYMYMYYIFQPN